MMMKTTIDYRDFRYELESRMQGRTDVDNHIKLGFVIKKKYNCVERKVIGRE